MKNANCKMQIAESAIHDFQFAIFNLQFWFSLVVGVAVLFRTAGSWAAEPRLLPQKLLDERWISLFDNETLYGWQPTGDAKWEVVDGEIRTEGVKAGFLMTTTEWADYLLHVEFKAAELTNSGVFLRTPLRPKDPARDCYELNIAPADNPFPTGSFVGRKKGKIKKFPAADRWHSFDVAVLNDEFAVRLDGKPVLQYIDAKPLRMGHIGLQSREEAVAFRNVRLKPLGLKPLFDGRDLIGWSKDRAEKCQFQVTDHGELHLMNGPGQIDTVADFANFVLQLDCKVNGKGLNSGVFFRTLRKGRWAGYESQIQNGFKDHDRTKPQDFGTGAIYRRQPARRVVADDLTWFTKTIVADGPHMAVWVNGYQVSDWTDTRPEKESGREGKRLGPGAIAIQGHDATTDFLFRKISAVELPR
jgi:hypothetical protein